MLICCVFSVSDDDEIDYSVKPEFYDSDIDYKDESWVQKKRKGGTSDAVLSCPSCFTTLCLDCQRYTRYMNVSTFFFFFIFFLQDCCGMIGSSILFYL